MLTRKQVLTAIKKKEWHGSAIDGRDIRRLIMFFPIKDFETFGIKIKKDALKKYSDWKPKPWSEKAILEQLKKDVGFGFGEAMKGHGFPAMLMNQVIKMWMWILENQLQSHDKYAMWGLPLLKAVALEYGFDNLIGDDTGSESKYKENVLI